MEEIEKTSKIESKETVLSSRDKLLSLEKEGKFVFHGSPDEIETLEPRQPLIYNVQKKEKEKHGNPCVAATPYADIAIFRAIVNSKNFSHGGYASFLKVDKEGVMKLATTKQVLEEIEDKKGFVYVLDKSVFDKFSNMEWRSESPIKPEDVIVVTAEDLPPNIQPIDKNFNPSKENSD